MLLESLNIPLIIQVPCLSVKRFTKGVVTTPHFLFLFLFFHLANLILILDEDGVVILIHAFIYKNLGQISR